MENSLCGTTALQKQKFLHITFSGSYHETISLYGNFIGMNSGLKWKVIYRHEIGTTVDQYTVAVKNIMQLLL